MKLKSILIALVVVLASGTTLSFASPGQSHGQARQAGPNGGRVITAVEPHAEFLVLPDRKVRITFLDDDGQPVAPADQVVIVTTGSRSAPLRLTFAQSGTALVSDAALPPGNNFPTVVQIKTAPDAKTVVARFNLNLANCPGCDRPEYACTCDH